jgi:isopenicillin N synthase-like dioxygenase
MNNDFPIFDLGKYACVSAQEKVALAANLDEICRSSGFLAVGNHGVPDEIIDEIWDATQAFFMLPSGQKQHARAPYEGYPYGYLGPGAEALAQSLGVKTPPDLKESFNGGPLGIPPNQTDPDALAFCYAQTIWPDQPAAFRAAWQAYYREMERLAARIMDVFADALELERGFFTPFINEPVSALRALNYPVQTVTPKPGQLRAGAHSDYGSLTILLPQPGSTGLEILTHAGTWRAVPPIPGAFVINIGDLMARWTNDRWVSTVHRVVNDGSTQKRQSLAFFHQPNWSAEICCLPSCITKQRGAIYPPVRSGPYLMEKFRSTTTG